MSVDARQSRTQLPATAKGPAVSSFVSPSPGGALLVALRDIAEALRYAPVWLHAGYVDVLWRFRRTRLGPFWHTLGLAAFVILMGVVWSKILNQDPVGYFHYVATSLIVWSLIASLITDGTSILIAGQSTALAMRYPYVAFAFAHVWRAFLLFAHHFVLYIVMMGTTLYNPGMVALLAIPGLLLVLANGVWLSLFVGMATLRHRDVGPALASGMQLMMFATPIFWPKDMLGPDLAWVSEYNPLYHLLHILQKPLLGQWPETASWLWALGCLVVGGLATLLVYGARRDRLVYWY